MVLDHLGMMLGLRYQHCGDVAALTEGLAVQGEAVRMTPSDDRLHLAKRRLSYGNKLHSLHRETRDPAHLDRAVDELVQAVTDWPEGEGAEGEFPLARNSLLTALIARSRVRSTATVIEETVSALRKASEAHPSDPVLHARHADWIFAGLFDHRCGDLGVDRAVESVRRTTADAAGGPEPYVRLLHYASLAVRLQHENAHPQTTPGEGHTARLEEALSFLDTALGLVTNEQSRSTCQWDQSAIRLDLYWATGLRKHLDRAIDDLDHALQVGALPPAHIAEGRALLGGALMTCYLRHEDTRALARAATAWHRALLSVELPSPQRESVELSLRQALEHLHHAGMDTTVRSALPRQPARAPASDAEVHRAAVLGMPLGSELLQQRVLALLAVLWHQLTSSEGKVGSHLREDSATVARWALRLVPTGHPQRADTAGKAADILYGSSVERNRRVELAEAVELYRCAAREAAPGDGKRLDYLKQLVLTLDDLRLATAQSSLRTEAIEAVRELRAATQPGSADQAEAAGVLAQLLIDRFYDTGDSTDLDEATLVLHGAAKSGPAELRIALRRKLASAQRARARIHNDSPYDEFLALFALQQARNLENESAAGAATRRYPLAERLRLGISSVDESLAALHGLLPTVSPHDEEALEFLELLVWDLRPVLAENSPHTDALDVVIRAREFLLGHSKQPARSPARASNQAALAWHLHRRFERSRDERDRIRAHELMREAAGNLLLSPEARVSCAEQLGIWSAQEGDWPRAARDLRDAIGLLPRMLPRQVPRDDLERGLSQTSGMTAEATAAALHCGDPGSALEMLEQGRAILHTYAMQTRQELVTVAAAAPRLAEEMQSVGERLSSARWNEPFGADKLSADDRHRLAMRWEELAREARQLPGCSELFAPVRAPALLAAPEGADPEGVVVIPNVSRTRCDALVIRAGELTSIPLPDVTVETLHERVLQFTETLPFANVNTDDESAQVMVQAPLREVLEWMWHALAHPVLEHLGLTGAPAAGRPLPRLWWVPTGLFSFLPLHAAGVSGVPGDSVLDWAISSYTVSVQALRNTQRTPRRPGTEGAQGPRLLAVGTVGPDTASERLSTPRMLKETLEVTRHFHDPVVLQGSAATRADVTAALQSCTWAHFACHGVSNPHRPSASYLQLHDEELGIAALARLHLPHAELVYLSACETASGGWALADEGITLAAACQLSGFKHALASMWPVLDSTSADTARLFYHHLAASPHHLAPASALHQTQLTLRERYPLLPTRWAPYLHVGP
ncbi:CHAT domain-containing protein [Streptomyces sp. ST1015]|nr:CHAT domain-containing protein [Streptomyces sp. ST1015]QZZ25581.1 CHAT domain-containing protein [Streptomyces sp. ST1015]